MEIPPLSTDISCHAKWQTDNGQKENGLMAGWPAGRPENNIIIIIIVIIMQFLVRLLH